MTASGSSTPLLWLVGSNTARNLLRFVAPLAPGGLGVREGMLVVLLAASYEVDVALAVALAIWLANVAGELLAVALVHGVCVIHAASTPVRRTMLEVIAGARDGWMVPGLWRTALHRHN